MWPLRVSSRTLPRQWRYESQKRSNRRGLNACLPCTRKDRLLIRCLGQSGGDTNELASGDGGLVLFGAHGTVRLHSVRIQDAGYHCSYTPTPTDDRLFRGTHSSMPQVAPLPDDAAALAICAFLIRSHSRPVFPPLASLSAFFCSLIVCAFTRGSMTTSSSSAFLR